MPISGIDTPATSARRAFTASSTMATPMTIIALWMNCTTPQPMK